MKNTPLKIFFVISLLLVVWYVGMNGTAEAKSKSHRKSKYRSNQDSNQQDSSSRYGRSDKWKISNAMSAAPSRISNNASVYDWPDANGHMNELQNGSNGWTCLPDFPDSPGNDPMCADKTSMMWMQAWMEHRKPSISQNGVVYMLQGGSDPSNTDPYAMTPAHGEDWMSAPPHIMILPAGNLDENLYGTDPDSGRPWVMYAGTPYEHLMIPVE